MGLRIERLVDVRDLVDVAVYGRSVGEQALVHVEIPLRHDSIAESRFEFLDTGRQISGKRAMPSTISAFVSQRNPVTPSHTTSGTSLDDARSTARRRPGLVDHQTERLRPDSATLRSVSAVAKNRQHGRSGNEGEC